VSTDRSSQQLNFVPSSSSLPHGAAKFWFDTGDCRDFGDDFAALVNMANKPDNLKTCLGKQTLAERLCRLRVSYFILHPYSTRHCKNGCVISRFFLSEKDVPQGVCSLSTTLRHGLARHSCPLLSFDSAAWVGLFLTARSLIDFFVRQMPSLDGASCKEGLPHPWHVHLACDQDRVRRILNQVRGTATIKASKALPSVGKEHMAEYFQMLSCNVAHPCLWAVIFSDQAAFRSRATVFVQIYIP